MSGAPAFARTVTFGRLVGVALPEHDDVTAAEALAGTLLPEERAQALALPAARRVTWLGGRVALRAALADLGHAAAAPIGATPRGAPTLPAGFGGSISHKHTIAVALAAPVPADVTLGVDVEHDRVPRVDISARILTDGERRRLEALPPAERPRAVVLAFAAKEAVYKALDPWLGRHIPWGEVEIEPEGLVATFTPRAGEPTFAIELSSEPLPGHLLVTARVQRRGG